MELSYISRNGNTKKRLIFEEVTFRAQKIKKKNTPKKFLIFQGMEISSPKLKKVLKNVFLMFQEELPKRQKPKFLSFSKKSYK